MSNNCFNLKVAVVMKIAVATLGNFHANPSLRYASFRTQLQVKQMLAGRLRRGGKYENKQY